MTYNVNGPLTQLKYLKMICFKLLFQQSLILNSVYILLFIKYYFFYINNDRNGWLLLQRSLTHSFNHDVYFNFKLTVLSLLKWESSGKYHKFKQVPLLVPILIAP